MRLLKLLISLAVIAAIAAWLTRPDEAAAEAELKTQLIEALDRLETDSDAGTAAAVLCKVNLDECYEFTRAAITTEYEDRTFYSVFRAEGFGEGYSCIGAFTKFVCSANSDAG
ncbi:hypothetical protein [Roseovarius sp. 2305UL8-3]|uniref:hypothetical protein n=1 Tax=Roseovarius conchicola TaxID=3121636 RepID=UPI003527B019